ncbi:MAG TPA: hypothetical protein VLK23_08090 [Thermodesulfobacteriota bacterium]|nr:hypothetical protein [Thermodesulfobacteriota bacterium]
MISHEYDKADCTEIYRIVHERMPELITLLEPPVDHEQQETAHRLCGAPRNATRGSLQARREGPPS